MELEFRKCTLSDLKVLVHISKSTFSESFEKDNDPDDFRKYIDSAFCEEELSSQLNNLNTFFYFVYLENILVGYFKLNIGDAQSDLKQDDSIELERIYVRHVYQGKGIGNYIIAKVKQLALKTGKSFLWLGVWEKNIRAISFYKEHGFVKFGKHPYYIGKDKQMDWLMRYELSQNSDKSMN